MQLTELASRQSLPPQAFRPTAELAVYPAVRELAFRFAGRWGGDVLLSEFTGPYGRVDFLLAVHDNSALEERRAAGLRPLSLLSEASVVAALSGRYARSVAEVSARSGAAANTVERVARVLARSGHVIVTDDGRYRRHAALRPVARTIALEAKVDDWKSALRQARTYALWSTWSVVVLDRLTNEDALCTEARQFGIGVAQHDDIVVHPRIQPRVPHLQLFASESYIGAAGLI